MKKQVLFIQGGGEDGYAADAPMVASLQRALGDNYTVHYPKMPSSENIMDIASKWLSEIGQQIASAKSDLTITAHSLGASILIKYLSEYSITTPIKGVFLIAPPFWNGDKDWVEPLKLKEGFAGQLPKDIPYFFYHSSDDAEVPFQHFLRYQEQLPHAIFRKITTGGHQLDNDLSAVARDISAV